MFKINENRKYSKENITKWWIKIDVTKKVILSEEILSTILMV